MTYNQESDQLEQEIKACSDLVARVLAETQKRIVGQNHIGRRLMMAVIAQGHVLLEGLPGLAKTTVIRTLAEVSALSFKRIQFTPDLLPADLTGTQIYDQGSGEFRVRKGPVFAHLVLADEINRAPAKVQSALLEAMEERQVTIGSKSWELEEPFLVMATQNPIEQEGTYPLPEAQLDHFLFKLIVTYPDAGEEELIIQRAAQKESVKIDKVIQKQDLRSMTALADRIFVSDKIRRYIVSLIHATRNPAQAGLHELKGMTETGASPRASIAMDRLARVNALLEGRSFVTPQDVKDIGHDILRHRIRVSYEAEAEGITPDHVISGIFEKIDVP